MNENTRALFAEGGAWAVTVRLIVWPLVKAYVPSKAREGVVAASCLLCGAAVCTYLPGVSFAEAVGAAFSGVGTAMLAHNAEKKIGAKQ